MEQNILKLKGDIDLNGYTVYSICMRGARLWDKSKTLRIYTNGNGDLIDTPIAVNANYEARIVSQKHFVFHDVEEKHCANNYDNKARNKSGLLYAMTSVYKDFEMSEIVTLLTFEINSERGSE
jgi:hypothetical protein